MMCRDLLRIHGQVEERKEVMSESEKKRERGEKERAN